LVSTEHGVSNILKEGAGKHQDGGFYTKLVVVARVGVWTSALACSVVAVVCVIMSFGWFALEKFWSLGRAALATVEVP